MPSDRTSGILAKPIGWLADQARTGAGRVVAAGTMAAATLTPSAPIDHAALFAAEKPTQQEVVQAPLSEEVREKLAPLFKEKVLDEAKVNRVFNDGAYAKNLDYILEKLPKARARGLKGVDLDEVFSLHPVVTHAIVRSAYITYQRIPVLEPRTAGSILDSKRVTGFGMKSQPSRQQVRKFVDEFVGRFVIPGMERNLAIEHERVGAAYTAADIERKTQYGYNKAYKGGFDDITLLITGPDPVEIASTKSR